MPSDSSEVDAAVLAKLAADAQLAALVNGAIYFDNAPQGLTKFVLVNQRAHEEAAMMPGATAFEKFTYIVQAIFQGTGGPDIKTAAQRIHTALHYQDLSIVGYQLMVMKRSERLRYPDRDELNNEWRHRGGIYEVWVTPTIA